MRDESIEQDLANALTKCNIPLPSISATVDRVLWEIKLWGLKDLAVDYDSIVFGVLRDGDFDLDIISYTFTSTNNFRDVYDDDKLELTFKYDVTDYLS